MSATAQVIVGALAAVGFVTVARLLWVAINEGPREVFRVRQASKLGHHVRLCTDGGRARLYVDGMEINARRFALSADPREYPNATVEFLVSAYDTDKLPTKEDTQDDGTRNV